MMEQKPLAYLRPGDIIKVTEMVFGGIEHDAIVRKVRRSFVDVTVFERSHPYVEEDSSGVRLVTPLVDPRDVRLKYLWHMDPVKGIGGDITFTDNGERHDYEFILVVPLWETP